MKTEAAQFLSDWFAGTGCDASCGTFWTNAFGADDVWDASAGKGSAFAGREGRVFRVDSFWPPIGRNA